MWMRMGGAWRVVNRQKCVCRWRRENIYKLIGECVCFIFMGGVGARARARGRRRRRAAARGWW